MGMAFGAFLVSLFKSRSHDLEPDLREQDFALIPPRIINILENYEAIK